MKSHVSQLLDYVFQSPLAQEPYLEKTNDYLLSTSFDELISNHQTNYIAKRNGLLRVSKLIENYAVQKKFPLLLDFQNVDRFNKSKTRILNVLNSVPFSYIIGNFPSKPQEIPKNSTVIDCKNNSLVQNWVVISMNKKSMCGLVCEEIDGEQFRGFFSNSSTILQLAIDFMSQNLGTEFESL